MEFNPPIEIRETDELIIISKSSTDEYQALAFELAKKELDKRKLSLADIDNRFSEIVAEHEIAVEQIMSEIAVEDYSLFEKIWIVIFWPKQLLHGWYLKKEGYHLKAKNRIKLILVGVILYASIVLFS
jgi:hypothetical protein